LNDVLRGLGAEHDIPQRGPGFLNTVKGREDGDSVDIIQKGPLPTAPHVRNATPDDVIYFLGFPNQRRRARGKHVGIPYAPFEMTHQGVSVEVLGLGRRLGEVTLVTDGLHYLRAKPLRETIGMVPLHTALLATEGAAVGVLL
jgi:hypothetical protein